jgi:hypothetical protein
MAAQAGAAQGDRLDRGVDQGTDDVSTASSRYLAGRLVAGSTEPRAGVV